MASDLGARDPRATDPGGTGRRLAFVASGTIEPSPPPANARGGPVAWARENLFAGPVNTAITVVILALVAWVTPGIVEWALIDAVWNASSLTECREKGDGACWAVIVERFDQFVYGFYPREEPYDLLWRVNLAFVLMLAAFAFALFDEVPFLTRETWARVRAYGLIFAACYPFLAYWLIWGGSIWYPLGLLATPAVGWAAMRAVERYAPPVEGVAVSSIAAVVAAIVWLFVFDDVASLFAAVLPLALVEVESRALGGFLLSTMIGVTGITLSLPIGILLALGRRSGLIFIQTLCTLFIEFIRGVPLITLLFVASSVLSFLFPPDTNLDLILRVVIMVTAFASAYMAEVIRGGLAGLSEGQYEAADAMGLTYWQSMRLIIMPQALKQSIPNIVSTFIGLFKDTTLVVVVGLLDPIGLITNIRGDSNWNGIVWEFYIFVGLFFFIACFAMSRYSMYLERKLATDRR
ncbi:MAG: amino acid ABC transporter permease [Paracoccaceae bacterium]